MYWITGRQECGGTFADAAFAKPDIICSTCEERHVLYAIRLPGNEVLQREIAPLLRRPVGTAEASSDPIRRLLVSCRELGPRSAGGGQGGVAQGTSCSLGWASVTSMTAGPEGVAILWSGSP